MKHIILIGHKKRMGKDTFASMLAELTGGKIIHFADPMKQIVADTFNITLDQLEIWKNKELGIPHVNGVIQSYRDILQRFGTEAMKKQFGTEIWADLVTEIVLEAAKTNDVIIIPDFRFPTEYDSIRRAFHNAGTVIRTVNITRRGIETQDTHSSETELDDFTYDIKLNNNSDLNSLQRAAESFASSIKKGQL